MKKKAITSLTLLLILLLTACNIKEKEPDSRIVFLHHSTGDVIWQGDSNTLFNKILRRISKNAHTGELPKLIKQHNKTISKFYTIDEITFPKASPYGWKNYPYDYYNIWVKNQGDEPFKDEPTLEILTRAYDVILFKHCFPVSNIKSNDAVADINSEEKTLENYKLQYLALRDKLNDFQDKKFILFTGAVQVKAKITEEEAIRASNFFQWVKNEWDQPGDNIFIWDLYSLQTEGGLYFKDEYAVSENNSHPTPQFADKAVKLLFKRIIDVIEDRGDLTNLTGQRE